MIDWSRPKRTKEIEAIKCFFDKDGNIKGLSDNYSVLFFGEARPTQLDQLFQRIKKEDKINLKKFIEDLIELRINYFEFQVIVQSVEGKIIHFNVYGSTLPFLSGLGVFEIDFVNIEYFLKISNLFDDLKRFNENIFKYTNEAIFIHDIEGNIVDVNDKAQIDTGYSKEELTKMNVFEIDIMNDGLSKFKPIWASMKPYEIFEIESKHTNKSGKINPVRIKLSKILFQNREYIMGLVENLSRLSILEQQLIQSQKMEVLGQLAAGMSHEFNNILGIILGTSEMLLKDGDPNCGNYQYIRQIKEMAERSVSLSRSFLNFKRKDTSIKAPLEINSALQDMIVLLEKSITMDITMELKLMDRPLYILIDPSYFQQIILNLCLNARDAIDGKGKIIIEVSELIVNSARFASIKVSDTGCGMSEAVRQNIFKPFFTTKPEGKGTGLGLSVVKSMVNEYNGSISVDSQVNKGTTFTLEFPALDASKVEREKVAETVPLVSGDKKTVMIVEDELNLLKLFQIGFEKSGFKVLASSNPNSALQIIKNLESKVDLLITDLVMPEMSGKELSEEVLKVQPDLKIIFISGYSRETSGVDFFDESRMLSRFW